MGAVGREMNGETERGFAKGGGEVLFLLLMVGGEKSLGRGYSRHKV